MKQLTFPATTILVAALLQVLTFAQNPTVVISCASCSVPIPLPPVQASVWADTPSDAALILQAATAQAGADAVAHIVCNAIACPGEEICERGNVQFTPGNDQIVFRSRPAQGVDTNGDGLDWIGAVTSSDREVYVCCSDCH